MEERKTLYRMNMLMKYTELEAFMAQKNAGSRAAYFDLLSEFLDRVPAMTESLAASQGGKDLDSFQKTIFELQKLLLSIGSSGLLWDAEKTAELARSGDRVKCGEKTSILVGKIKSLCDKLIDARIDPLSTAPQTDGMSDTIVVAMAQDAGASGRQRVAVEPEQFETLGQLIANFETDQALALLQNMMASSYNNAIDSLLAALHYDLAHFDHDNAEAQFRKLLDTVREVKADAGQAKKKKILAVDDVPDVLNTVKSVLKDDYAVYGVTNHMAALKFLTSNSPDLILLDIEMPDMDGFSLLGIIRQIKAYEATPALFLTGSVTVDNIIKSRKAGGNDFLKKPIDAQVLLSKIRKHLG